MYTAFLCFGMLWNICGSVKQFEVPTEKECQALIQQVPDSAIGKGYKMCIPPNAKFVSK